MSRVLVAARKKMFVASDDGGTSGRERWENGLFLNEDGMKSPTAGGKGAVSPERRKTVHLAMHQIVQARVHDMPRAGQGLPGMVKSNSVEPVNRHGLTPRRESAVDLL